MVKLTKQWWLIVKRYIFRFKGGGVYIFLSRAVQARNIFHTFSFFLLIYHNKPKGRGELNKINYLGCFWKVEQKFLVNRKRKIRRCIPVCRINPRCHICSLRSKRMLHLRHKMFIFEWQYEDLWSGFQTTKNNDECRLSGP